MKKRFIAFIIVACLALFVFAGCSQSPVNVQESATGSVSAVNVKPSSTASASNTALAIATTAAIKTAYASAAAVPSGSIEIKGVTFDQGATTFFNGNPAENIGKLSPLLISAAQAEFAMKKPLYPDESPDTSVEWGVVYQYLNSFGDQASNMKKLEDGSLIVSGDEMKTVFASLFSFFKGTVPAVKTNYAITYDEKSNTYTVGRSDFGDISFKVTDFQLSKANSATDPTISATLTLSAFDSDGKNAGDIRVEIVPKAGTYYGYSVQSVE